ncbi:DgyrCDS1371 [Dimorphilus gyrociliatus]|uniref:DgyrCDS1371 n=1 Tax=Dimorphilus gyrociliatus TaxID=2664684 RepID=A0A7I8V974_9ANNE|nr:DgyrCDS1371 [Dimorphilus gyrociliatus]
MTQAVKKACEKPGEKKQVQFGGVVEYIPFSFNLPLLLPYCQLVELTFSSYVQDLNSLPITNSKLHKQLNLSHSQTSYLKIDEDGNHPIEILYNQFLSSIEKLHDKQYDLTKSDCEQLIELIKARRRSDDAISCPILFDRSDSDVPEWKCFLKTVENQGQQLSITFVPKSYADFIMLVCDNEFIKERSEKPSRRRSRNKGPDVGLSPKSSPSTDESSAKNITDSDSDLKRDFPEIDSCTEKGSQYSWKSLIIPVYVFSSNLDSLKQSLYRRDASRPCDVYDNFTFQRQPNRESSENSKEDKNRRINSPYRKKRLDSEGDRRCRNESESSWKGRQRSKSGDKNYIYDATTRKLCVYLRETYLRCFVAGIFKSLRRNFYVDKNDAERINEICEEHILHEIDISLFLQHVCGHCTTEENEDDSSVTKLINIHEDLCEKVSDLHQNIQERYQAILNKYFQKIPTAPELYYYCGNKPQKGQYEETFKVDTEEILKFSLIDDKSLDNTATCPEDKASNLSIKDEESTSEEDDDDDFSLVQFDGELGCNEAVNPLFVTFWCTIRLSKKSLDMDSMPLTNLPVCFKNLDDCIDLEQDLNLNDFRITLDIYCLTLSPVDEDVLSDSADRSFLQRMTSINSDYIDTTIPKAEDEETLEEYGDIHTKMIFSHHHYPNIPQSQQNSLSSCRKRIQWLLEDEIVSAKRSLPVSEHSLSMVADHVDGTRKMRTEEVFDNDLNLSTFYYEEVPLRFVFGPDESYEHFVEHFENIELKSYKLEKMGQFYYACSNEIPITVAEISDENDDILVITDSGAEPVITEYIRQNSCPISEATKVIVETTESRSSSPNSESSSSILVLHDDDSNRSSFCLDETASCASSLTVVGTSFKEGFTENPKLREDTASNLLLAAEKVEKIRDNTLAQSPTRDKTKVKSDSIPTVNKQVNDLKKSISTPVSRQPSGTRSRHHSGLHTPLSTVDLSSRGSAVGEEGYDGDESNIGESDIDIGPHDKHLNATPYNFWLIFKLEHDKVTVYLHTREMWSNEVTNTKHKSLFTDVIRQIKKNNKTVNQKLLLDDLFNTKICDMLLVDNDEGDVKWSNANDKKRGSDSESDHEEEKNIFDRRFYQPGFFACDSVWHHEFKLHQRLQQRATSNLKNVFEKVMRPFKVKNRGKLYVLKDEEKNRVFYFTLEEKDKDDKEVAPQKSGSSKEGSSEAEYVELVVYGISEPTSAVTQDLVKHIQKALDDQVLSLLYLLLGRNVSARLNSKDVKFLQGETIDDQPAEIIQVNIPQLPIVVVNGESLMYYLRQNLKVFLNTPKYLSNDEDNLFRNYTIDTAPPIKETDIFMNRSNTNIGLAVIHLSVVDGSGKETQFLRSYLKPRYDNYKSSPHKDSLFSVVAASPYEGEAKQSPGPTALIKFSIWERGSVGLLQLRDQLILALTHSICDVIMEYQILTAPICQSDKSDRNMDSFKSAPPSPSCKKYGPFHQAESLSPVARELQFDTNLKTKRSKSFIFGETAKSRWKSGSSVPKVNLQLEPVSLLRAVPSSIDAEDQHHIALKYEKGEIGNLHYIMADLMPQWFSCCESLGVPSIKKVSLNLQSQTAIDYVLHDLRVKIQTLPYFLTCRVFKRNNQNDYVNYKPSRSPILMQNPSQCKVDELAKIDYILVARDYDHWCSFIEFDDNLHDPIKSIKKRKKDLQKWEGVSNTALAEDATEKSQSQFIPRQNFLFLTESDKTFNLWTYNWVTQTMDTLSDYLTKIIHWHNLRDHVLNSIVHQKMGLFQHKKMTELPNELKSKNHLTTASSEVDLLVKYTSAPTNELNKRSRSKQNLSNSKSRLEEKGGFDAIYRGRNPPLPLHADPKYGILRDPLHRHGGQMLELRGGAVIEREENETLRQVQNNWNKNKYSGPPPISRVTVELIKKKSRLIHQVSTPLLFEQPKREVPITSRRPSLQTSDYTDGNAFYFEKKSRHNSGASNKNVKVDKRIDDVVAKLKSEEDSCLNKIKFEFILQYINYFETEFSFKRVTFLSMDSGPPTSKPLARRRSSVLSNNLQYLTYLQKVAFLGGIVLLEIGFSSNSFVVNVFAYECNRHMSYRQFPYHSDLFTKDCDKYKEITHVHSFSNDFHLRLLSEDVKAILNGQKTAVDFDIITFLHSLVHYFQYPPTFARNYVVRGEFSKALTGTNSEQVFEYMLAHGKTFGLTEIKIRKTDDFHSFSATDDRALVAQKIIDRENLPNNIPEYVVTTIISRDLSTPPERLKFTFFVILTTEIVTYPNQSWFDEKKVTEEMSDETFSATDQLKMSLDDHIWADKEVVYDPKTNYMGFSNAHQTPVYNIAVREADGLRKKIVELTDIFVMHQRIDALWDRILELPTTTKEQKRSKKKELKPLTVESINQSLKNVERIDITHIDRRLSFLKNLNLSQYISLVDIIQQKKSLQFRQYISEGSRCSIVISKNKTILILLEIEDEMGVTEVSIVQKKPISESKGQTDETFTDLSELYDHIEEFVDCCCFFLWSHFISCPGVWLPHKEQVYLCVRLFGQYRCTQLIEPIFPLIFNESFTFDKIFYTAYKPEQLCHRMEEELVHIELVQLSDTRAGRRILAEYQISAKEFLFPYPTFSPSYSSTDRQILLERGLSFPGISPKMEFSTRTNIQETCIAAVTGFEPSIFTKKMAKKSRSRIRSASPTRRSNSSSPGYSPSYSRPTVAAANHCRSSLEGRFSCLDICNGNPIETDTDTRPPFVVRKVEKSLISRTPGGLDYSSKRKKNKSKQSECSHVSTPFLDKKCAVCHLYKRYLGKSYIGHPLFHKKIKSKVVKEPNGTHIHFHEYSDDDWTDEDVPELATTNGNYRPSYRSASPTLHRPSLKERFADYATSFDSLDHLAVDFELAKNRRYYPYY